MSPEYDPDVNPNVTTLGELPKELREWIVKLMVANWMNQGKEAKEND